MLNPVAPGSMTSSRTGSIVTSIEVARCTVGRLKHGVPGVLKRIDQSAPDRGVIFNHQHRGMGYEQVSVEYWIIR
ncbi:MAG: hypothetical protein M5U08_14115 [Burkholderiales bacterium]|nr:hypothetical protein [Burkholderiales bacterium]